jgi:ribosome maturation factor RimP
LNVQTGVQGSSLGSKLRGEVRSAGDDAVTVVADGGEIEVPYAQIVRGNLIDEREQ